MEWVKPHDLWRMCSHRVVALLYLPNALLLDALTTSLNERFQFVFVVHQLRLETLSSRVGRYTRVLYR